MSMSTAAWSYVGIEIVAATAMEVRWPKSDERRKSNIPQRSELSSLIGKTVKFSAIWISVLATLTYTLSGVLMTFNIERTDCHLRQFSWAQDTTCSKNTTSSGFVAIAEMSKIPGLAHAFNSFLLYTALTCAMTNLYVASRTLFGLTSRLDDGPGQPWHLRILAWFGKTNKRRVPVRAMIISALAFSWVPFLKLGDGKAGEPNNSIESFIDVLPSMGSNGVIIVWASLKGTETISRTREYRKFDLLVFFGLWISLKLVRGAKWALVDLSKADRVVTKIRNLHDIRQVPRAPKILCLDTESMFNNPGELREMRCRPLPQGQQQQHHQEEQQKTPPTSLPDLIATIRSEWRSTLNGTNPGFIPAMATPFAVLLFFLLYGIHAKIAVPVACVMGIVPIWWLKPKINDTAKKMQRSKVA
ncbi:hypothetical protein SLS62_006628 [Diatrype stigma]|uniref:Amino acid permease/ SLC12A domain-containing protein n=1 Tax=Diatrype stigma TaxID=117547 RepID=A0AAN9UQB7_9PEZI